MADRVLMVMPPLNLATTAQAHLFSSTLRLFITVDTSCNTRNAPLTTEATARLPPDISGALSRWDITVLVAWPLPFSATRCHSIGGRRSGLTLAGAPGFTGTLWAACGLVRLGAALDAGSPGELGVMLVADPLRSPAGGHGDAFWEQPWISSMVPLCCELWQQGCQGSASAWVPASTEGAATVLQRSCFDCGLPLVRLPTAACLAQPRSPEVGPERHIGWGCVPVFGGMPLLRQLWPAAQGRVACTQQLAHHRSI